MSRQMFGTERRYVIEDEKEYLVDVFNLNGFTALAQDMISGKYGKGSHETSESIAITNAISKIKD